MYTQQKDNLILQLTFQFALDVITLTEELEAKRKFNLANQLFRSGTSIGANDREAQGCESRADFLHKMKIAYKEAEETQYWLELCLQSANYPDPTDLLSKLASVQRVLGKIISSAKNNGEEEVLSTRTFAHLHIRLSISPLHQLHRKNPNIL
jgi:four helix bundle protein